MSTLDLSITKTIPAPAKDVFEAWLDPKALAAFIRPAPNMEAPKVEVDAREGGTFSIVMKAGDQELPHSGEYKTIDPHRTIAFTWVSSYTIPDSLVTLTFEAVDDKTTKLTLRHEGFPNEESRNNHQGGWGTICDLLAKQVA